ncbi:MAG: HEAT repeat domain-containing protein [Polyangia bacterium]
MASEAVATVLSRRCPRCSGFYPFDAEHVCAGSSGAVTLQSPAPATVSVPAALAPTLEGPSPDTVPTAPGTPPAAATGRAEGRAALPVDLVGLILGERYEILERLSAGGMGVVYKARHIVLDSLVAVKVLLKQKDPQAQRRFLVEAKLASSIRHPNTVYISDFGVLPDGRSYLVMEFLQGPTLAKLLRGGRLDPLRACRLTLQIAEGLQTVHARGIVHRDLKPDNIFVLRDEAGKEHVKIVDFGIAVAARTDEAQREPQPASAAAERAAAAETATRSTGEVGPLPSELRERITVAGAVIGTPQYMAPEQALGGELDARADQYALGCILFEMLTGHVPFDHPSSPTAILVKHQRDPVPSLRSLAPAARVPAGVEEILLRMLAKRPEERFASLQEVVAALLPEIANMSPNEELLTGGREGALPRPTGRSTLTTKVLLRPKRWQLFAAAAGLCALVGGSAVLGVRQVLLGRRGEQAVPRAVIDSLRERAVEVLRQQLGAPATELRLGAATALGRSRDVALRPLIEPLLVSPDPALAARAAEALGELGDTEAAPALWRLCEQTGALPVKAAAAAALDQLGDPRGGHELVHMLDSPDPRARLRAAYILVEKGDGKAVAVLGRLVEGAELPDELKVDALVRLAQAGEGSAQKQLKLRAQTASSAPRRLLLLRRLAELGDDEARQRLSEAAARPGPDQLIAARIASEAQNVEGAPLLRRFAESPQSTPAERLLAVEGLGLVGRVQDLLLLRPHLEPTVAENLKQAAAGSALQLLLTVPGLLSERSLRWASAALRDSNGAVREAAVAVVGELEGEGAARLLSQALADKEPQVRRTAVQKLARRPSRQALLQLRELLYDGDAAVREEVLRGVLRIGKVLRQQGQAGLTEEVGGWLKGLLGQRGLQEVVLARTVLLKLGDESQRAALQELGVSQDAAARRAVVRESEGTSDAQPLYAALSDSDPAVRTLAARRLAEAGDRRAEPVLRAALQGGGLDGLWAYGLLRRLGLDASLPPDLGDTLSSAAVGARLGAVEALGRLPAEVAAPILSFLARDPERLVRRLVAETAAELGAASAPQATPATVPAGAYGAGVLRILARDSDAGVRFRAEQLLLRVSAGQPSTTATPPLPALPSEVKLRRPLAAPPPLSAPAAVTAVEPTPAPEPPPEATAGEAQLLLSPPGAVYQLDGRGWQLAGRPLTVSSGAHTLRTLGGEVEVTLAAGERKPLSLQESEIEAQARAGLEAYRKKDVGPALKKMQKAIKACERKRGFEVPCALVEAELYLRTGELHEQAGELTVAIADFAEAQRLAGRARLRDDLVSASTQAFERLRPKMAQVSYPKIEKGKCRVATLWLERGKQVLSIGGTTEYVTVQGGEKIDKGGCN